MATFNPELVLSTTIAKSLTLTARLGDYPQEAVDKFLTYGFQRWHNDGLGGADVSVEDKCKAAQVKFDQAKRGIVGRTRGEAVDPFMTIVLRIVKRMVKAKNADNYKKIMVGDKPDAVFAAILNKAKENKPETYAAIMNEATAERKAQERKAAFIESTVDLADTSDL